MMFATLMERAARLAERRARARIDEVGASLRAMLPGDVGVDTDADGVRLAARGLARRLALDPALRWLGARL